MADLSGPLPELAEVNLTIRRWCGIRKGKVAARRIQRFANAGLREVLGICLFHENI